MTEGDKILFLTTVWPAVWNSAAGVRDIEMIRALRSRNVETWVASAANPDPRILSEIQDMGAFTHELLLNHSSFDHWIRDLNPAAVIFDRFVVEEKFGSRVTRACPNALRILDTQDLHFVRRARLRGEAPLDWSGGIPQEVLREIASVFRCDGTWIVSSWEYQVLRGLGIRHEVLSILPIPADPEPNWPSYSERMGFAWIGNFQHGPNYQAVQYFLKEIWPLIRGRLPHAWVRIAGAFVPKEMTALSDASQGIEIMGWVPNARDFLAQARVNVAPLLSGAGIKGKILEGWAVGTPCTATLIAAEGMSEGLSWGGGIGDTPSEFARIACELHEDSRAWEEASQSGLAILRSKYSRRLIDQKLFDDLSQWMRNKERMRSQNLVGAILQDSLHRGYDFFSRWLEIKAQLDSKGM